ncbi:coadhesin-like [Clytia hemisphaerica]|uniref:VWFA domain-containing protein n=1 Tax=Clytia hemisphaerica TaxID=252671 RepID=A0A7M5VFU3_9CNID|eukprot:TCONS_00059597-protein
MNFGIILTATLVAAVLGSVPLTPPEKCTRTWKKIGCFHDRIIPNRPLPYEVANHRDPINKNWDGHLINWQKWPESLHALACKCAALTKGRGHRYFGLQFYGECWTGPSLQYDRDGPSKSCIGIDYKACEDKSQTECVGKAFTNYIYDTHTDVETPTDGGWSTWQSWSSCTKSCGGGARERTRSCTNPRPSNGGQSCTGEKVEESSCNTDTCVPVCNKNIDIAVITDASTSVTSKNYLKVKEFVVKLTEEFHVGKDQTHFAMIHFAWRAYLDFNFADKEFWDVYNLRNKIMSSKYTYGGTRTDLALKMAEEKVFCDSCGTRGPNVPKVLIVITDGKSSYSSQTMTEASKGLKGKKVTIISMGIGRAIDNDELVEIATDREHVFVADDFKYMIDKLNSITRLSCQAQYDIDSFRMIE